MVKQFSGKTYELDLSSQENMEALQDAMGVKDAGMRQAFLTMKSSQTLTLAGDLWTEVVEFGDRKQSVSFKLGEEFDEKSYEGKPIKSVVNQKGADTLVHVQKHSDGRVVTFEKQYSPDKMIMTITAGGVSAKRTFKAV